MDKGIAVLSMAIVGGLIALQAPVNAGLAKATGSFAAALVSFIIGTAALAAIVVLSGRAAGVADATSVDWYYLIGEDPIDKQMRAASRYARVFLRGRQNPSLTVEVFSQSPSPDSALLDAFAKLVAAELDKWTPPGTETCCGAVLADLSCASPSVISDCAWATSSSDAAADARAPATAAAVAFRVLSACVYCRCGISSFSASGS